MEYKEKRDSLIFYRSFYEALKEVDNDTKAKVYDAIFEYSLNFNTIELTGMANVLFTLIKPQLDANNQRFKNGNKGGRPKKEKPNDNQEITKTKPNYNLNETKTKANNNVNNNVNKEEYIMSENKFSDDSLLIDLDVSDSSSEIKITKAFFDLFRKNKLEQGVTTFTQYDKTKLSKWLIHIERMIKIDNIELIQLRELYAWLSDDSHKNSKFWRKNILSTEKLRDKYPDLQIAMNEDLKQLQTKSKERDFARCGL